MVPSTIETERGHGCGQIEHLGKEYDAWETGMGIFSWFAKERKTHKGHVGSCLVLWKVPWSQTVGFPDGPEQFALEQIAAGLGRRHTGSSRNKIDSCLGSQPPLWALNHLFCSPRAASKNTVRLTSDCDFSQNFSTASY